MSSGKAYFSTGAPQHAPRRALYVVEGDKMAGEDRANVRVGALSDLADELRAGEALHVENHGRQRVARGPVERGGARGRAEPAAGRRLAQPARLLGRPPGRAARHRRRRVQAPRRPEEGVPVALRRLKVEFFRGRDWRGWTAEAFIAELSGYIRWYREGRLKAFDGGGGAVYDTIAGRRARPGTAA